MERHYAAKLAQGKWQQVAAALARRGFSHSVIRQVLACLLYTSAGPKVQSALMTLSACAGVALAIFLFTFLPTFLTGLVAKVIPMGRWPRVILEAVLKLAIFLGYMFLCTRMKEIHRMFQYHGAEHKTIACYEAGEELTVADVYKRQRIHWPTVLAPAPRALPCGLRW